MLVRGRSSSTSSAGSLGETHERLELNHRLQCTVLEPRHSEIIGEKLATVHAQGRRSRVLDVGAGTGAFAFTLANAQPFADIVAVDIDWSNFANVRSHHGNVDLQTIDLTQPLPFDSSFFDVIHMKSMHLSIPYYTTLVERLARVLAPGGLLVLAECEPTYLSTSGPSTHRSMRQWDAAVREAYAAQQIDVDLPSNLLSCLSTSAVFATPVYTQELCVPCGSYVRSPFPFPSPPDTPGSYISTKTDPSTLIYAGRLHAQVLAANMRSMMPVLMAYGYGQDDLELLVEDCVNLSGFDVLSADFCGICYQDPIISARRELATTEKSRGQGGVAFLGINRTFPFHHLPGRQS